MGVLFIIVIAVVLLLYSVYTLWPALHNSVDTLVAPGPSQVFPFAVKHPRVESQVESREGATSRLGSKAPWGLLIARERLALWILFVAALLLRVLFLVLQRYLSPEAVLTTWKQAYNRSVYRGDGPFV